MSRSLNIKKYCHKLNFVLTQRLKQVTGLFRKGDCIIDEKLQVKFGVFHSFSFWVGPEGHFAIFLLSRFTNFFIILSVSLSVSLFPFFFLLQFLFSTTLLGSFIFTTSKKLSVSPFYKDFRLKLTNGTKHFVSAEGLHSKALKRPAFRNLLGRIIYIDQRQVQNELLDVSLARRRNLNVL